MKFNYEIEFIDLFCEFLETKNIEYKRELNPGYPYHNAKIDIVIRENNHLIGIEAKIKKFEAVYGQALGNRVFTPYNSVLFPIKPSEEKLNELKQNRIGLYIYDFKLNTFICLLPSIKSELTSQSFYNKLKKNWNLNKCGRLFNKSELPENYELKNMYSKNWNKINLYRNEQINLHKKCKNCGKYFPAELLSIEKYCPECVEDSSIIDWVKFFINRLKKSRSISLDVFDVYDLERPYKDYGKVIVYERVCRICGSPLKKKDGSYSYHLRYCEKHRGHGDILYTKFNWGSCSKAYIKKTQFKNRKKIRKKLKEIKIPKELSHLVVICEECNELCQRSDLYYFSFSKEYKDILEALPITNVHHIIPVHLLDRSNIRLIWDFKNLVCLCLKCHHDKHKSRKLDKGILLSRLHKTLDHFI